MKVIRTQTKSWRYPFCTNCHDWLDLDAELEQLDNEEGRLTEQIKLGIQYKKHGIPALPTQQMLIVVLITVLTLGIGLLALPFFLSQHRQACQALIDGLARNNLDRDACREEAKRLQRRMRRLVPSGVTPVRSAVEYVGWDGSIHTFWFANSEYARRFISRNSSKIVGK